MMSTEKRIEELLTLIDKDVKLIDAFEECGADLTHLNITGLCEQQKGFLAAALCKKHDKKPVIIVPDPARARMLTGYLRPFVKGDIVVVQPREMSLVNAMASSHDTESERLGNIEKLMTNDFGAALICAGAMMNRMMPVKEFKKYCLDIKLGETIDPSDLKESLIEAGYERVNMVASPGEFSWRGDVMDIYTPNVGQPVRIGFFDDEVDQIKTFDADNQRSVEQLKKVKVMPAREILIKHERATEVSRLINGAANEDAKIMKQNGKIAAAEALLKTAEADSEFIREGVRVSGIEKWVPMILEEFDTLDKYIDFKRTEVFADELAEIKARADSYLGEFYTRCKAAFEIGSVSKKSFEAAIAVYDMMKNLDGIKAMIALSCLNSSGNGLPGGRTVTVTGLAGDSFRGREKELSLQVKSCSFNSDEVIALLATGDQRIEKLNDILVSEGAVLEVIHKDLPSGFIYPAIGLTLIGEQDVFGSEKTIRKKKKGGASLDIFNDLKVGDYVVHDVHGIGLYEGLVNMKVGDVSQDYLKISYAKGAVLYITLDNLQSIQRYVGPNSSSPKLSDLNSQEWTKSVDRAKSSIKRLAFDLVKLYAARRANRGFACGPDDVWQTEFEENFPYVETDDQLSAVKDIKRDMESEVPMDRLLCGDVGFGKTEVAFRAIFKAVANGKQVFMLSPTTLLAQQHYENFKERLGTFPVRTALLSRFVPHKQMEQTIKDIKEGTVDVVIGTHRLLSKDVVAKDLGLLVIDEEQRFGVNHKEQIKNMRNTVDVLSLSATPIPRTLHMSMSGIRDISVLDDPPMNRRPVQTYVMPYNEETVVQACMREVSRKGQVFYLYNKTSDIDKKARELEKLMPGVRVVYAHGQMSEDYLENVITRFVSGEADILVCTTIIESGVDMPNVNTMIVENGDRFGLSQLYQIKGRVGRSDKQAYAYITYDEEKSMNDDARKRLMAIREFTELGSGIKIALRDLEVRGAGNLLGAEQHGQMNVIGYELYCRLLDEEIKHLRDEGDESVLELIQASVELEFDSYIPTSYIDDETSRMVVYRRISNITNTKEYEDFIDEVLDRYGDPPTQVIVLADVALIRAYASKLGFDRVIIKDDKVLLYYAPSRKIDMFAVGELVNSKEFEGKVLLNAAGRPYLHYMPMKLSKKDVITNTRRLLTIMSDALEKEKEEAASSNNPNATT